MIVAFHFDSMHSELDGVGGYHFAAYERILGALLAQDSQIDSRISSGDLLFGHVPDRQTADVVGSWFFPQNPGWTKPNGVDWNLPPHACIYVVCFENIDQRTVEQTAQALTRSASYLGAMEVGTSPIHQLLRSKLPSRLRIVGRTARVLGVTEADTDEASYPFLRSLGFDSVSWECG